MLQELYDYEKFETPRTTAKDDQERIARCIDYLLQLEILSLFVAFVFCHQLSFWPSTSGKCSHR